VVDESGDFVVEKEVVMNGNRICKAVTMCVCVFLGSNSVQGAGVGLDGQHMNGLRIISRTWYPTHGGQTVVIPVEITNESSEDKEDVRIYVTGVMASPWGLLTYKKGSGTWEKRSQYTGETLRAVVGGPKAALPSDQERNVGPGSSLDAIYPYIAVGPLDSQETKSKKISVGFHGSGHHYAPYTFWLCLASGGQKISHKNRAPTAYDAEVATPVDTPVQITLHATDPDGDELTYAIRAPLNGSLTGNVPPTVTYTPDPGFVGIDSFAFVAFDKKAESNTATVTITVGSSMLPKVVITPQDGAPVVVFIQKDASLEHSALDTNFGSHPYLGAATPDYPANYSRGILEFDISDLPTTVASVKLMVHGVPRLLYGDVSAHKVTSPWEEMTVTWNTMPSFDVAPIDIESPDIERWYEWDITGLYGEWKSGASENHGLLLMNQMEGIARTGIILKSSDWVE